jgi:GPH family glycoside/pentoside/hexuronide:cation symporter
MKRTKENNNDKVHSRKGHFLYSLGAVPSALPYNMISSFFVFFYVTVRHLDLTLSGWIWVIYGIWNAINDPLIGFYMDKKKTKWGRRVPYIVIGTIPFTIGFIFLWWVPYSSSEQTFIFLHALLMLFLFDLGFTLCMTGWSALYTEMYEDEGERATVVAIKDTIAFISSFIGIMIPPMIADAIGWELAGVIIGITIPITMLLSLLGSKERVEYQIDKPLPIFTAIKETAKNKPFLIITLTYTLLDYGFGLTIMVLPLYAKFILQVDEGLVGVAAAGVAVGILISIPFWRHIYAKRGPKYGLLLAMIIFSLGIWPLFLIDDFIILVIVTIFPGFGAAGMLMTEPAISTAIDYDELRTKKRREASYTGILTLIARLSLVFSGITLIIVGLFTGFDSEAETQTPTALLGLRVLVGFVPLFGTVLGILVFKFFPISHEVFIQQQHQLKILHEERIERLEKEKS